FISSQVTGAGNGIEASFRVWSVLTNKEIFKKSYKLTRDTLRSEGHQVADGIYRSITGKPSIFTSKIVFLSDRTTVGRDILKELYIMDFDGRRVERLTNFNSVVIGPAIAPDNSKIMFSVIASHQSGTPRKKKTTKNIDLKILDLRTKKISSVSERPGINSGAIFGASGEDIYLT